MSAIIIIIIYLHHENRNIDYCDNTNWNPFFYLNIIEAGSNDFQKTSFVSDKPFQFL